MAKGERMRRMGSRGTKFRLSSTKALGVILALSCVAGFAGTAHAEPAASQAEPEATATGTAPEAEPEAAERDDDPMAGIGLGLKAGFMHYKEAVYHHALETTLGEVALPPIEAPARNSAKVGLELFLGSTGFGWDTELYLMFDDSLVVGGFTGPAIRFHIKRMYFSIGAGLQVGYLTDDRYDLGLDLYGRFPVSITYYVADAVGLMFEFGFGWGATGVRPKASSFGNLDQLPPAIRDEINSRVDAFDIQYARSGLFDCAIGLRFP